MTIYLLTTLDDGQFERAKQPTRPLPPGASNVHKKPRVSPRPLTSAANSGDEKREAPRSLEENSGGRGSVWRGGDFAMIYPLGVIHANRQPARFHRCSDRHAHARRQGFAFLEAVIANLNGNTLGDGVSHRAIAAAQATFIRGKPLDGTGRPPLSSPTPTATSHRAGPTADAEAGGVRLQAPTAAGRRLNCSFAPACR